MTTTGSKVVCINNDAMDLFTLKGLIPVGPAWNLDVGMVYTVTQIFTQEDLGISSYKLAGVPMDSGIVSLHLDIPGYAAQRFRPVQETKAKAEKKQTVKPPKVKENVR